MSVITSVGWFVASQADVDIAKEFALDLGINLQLSFFERQDVENFMWDLRECKDRIHTIHLFKGIVESDFFKGDVVNELANAFDVKRFVIHPFSDDVPLMVDRAREKGWTLCLETFRRHLANPLTMISTFGEELETEHLGMCVDFSHLPNGLSNSDFVKELLPYTKVWHVSNRKGKQQHLPLFTQDTDTHAQGILSRCLQVKKFPVQEIVLEYMKAHKDKIAKQYFWLKSYVMKKRRVFDDGEI